MDARLPTLSRKRKVALTVLAVAAMIAIPGASLLLVSILVRYIRTKLKGCRNGSPSSTSL